MERTHYKHARVEFTPPAKKSLKTENSDTSGTNNTFGTKKAPKGAVKKNRIAGHSATSEKALERRLVKECESRGWLCLKYSNMTATGYPDRLIVLPGGFVAWAEIKSHGKKPTPLQAHRHEELRELDHIVAMIDSPCALDNFMWELSGFENDELMS